MAPHKALPSVETVCWLIDCVGGDGNRSADYSKATKALLSVEAA
jgi:hypothetical protein